MQDQVTRAFAALNAQMLERQTAWFEGRNAAVREYYKSAERVAAMDALRHTPRGEAQKVRDADTRKLENIAGGKGWLALIWANPTPGHRADVIVKNVRTQIARRDAQITAALGKVGVTSIPDFTLTECSDGAEGTFLVAGHTVTIRTILAGGYNIQCLHNRTLVKVRCAAMEDAA